MALLQKCNNHCIQMQPQTMFLFRASRQDPLMLFSNIYIFILIVARLIYLNGNSRSFYKQKFFRLIYGDNVVKFFSNQIDYVWH